MKLIDKIMVGIVVALLITNIVASFVFAYETGRLVPPSRHLKNSVDNLRNKAK